MSELRRLEQQAIFILREAALSFDRPAMLWSMGKDSCVLLHLTLKAFLGRVPWPVVHVDTGYEFEEMLTFRAAVAKRHNLDLRILRNASAIEGGMGYEHHDPITVTHTLKTLPLQAAVRRHNWDALIAGIRRDEDATRAKERTFSRRDKDFAWAYQSQQPEVWHYYLTGLEPSEHMRVHPLLEWTELDVWHYVRQQNIALPPLYFARNGLRYRSVGCRPITEPVKSDAATLDDIIAEVARAQTSERMGRVGDACGAYAMLKLRAKGFM